MTRRRLTRAELDALELELDGRLVELRAVLLEEDDLPEEFVRVHAAGLRAAYWLGYRDCRNQGGALLDELGDIWWVVE